MKRKWSVVLAAILVGVACIPFAVNGCGPNNTVSQGGINQDMNEDIIVRTEVAAFALG